MLQFYWIRTCIFFLQDPQKIHKNVELWEALLSILNRFKKKNMITSGNRRQGSWRTNPTVSVIRWGWLLLLTVLWWEMSHGRVPLMGWLIPGEANYWSDLGIWTRSDEERIQKVVGAELQVGRALKVPEVPNVGAARSLWGLVIQQFLPLSPVALKLIKRDFYCLPSKQP